MDIHEAKKIIDDQEINLIDIRDELSYNTAHIQGAVHISDETIEEYIQIADKSIPLLCYCYHGISSKNAASYFVEQGFEKVYSIDGGFEDWKQHYPTESS